MSSETITTPQLRREVGRRRTFAIISHPDAGKTTLTEKLLLYGGCVDVAGAVRGRKTRQAARSDWMDLERQRGISVSSTALCFEYADHQINLLDTPGHEDFSEDTYRTLMAADAAVMVIDLAKGIESQTEKLFRVCALRKLPIITFVNKVDRPGQDPLDVLAEIEEKLGIDAIAWNWPIGTGPDFRGVYELGTSKAHLFDRGRAGDRAVPYQTLDLDRLRKTRLPERVLTKVLDDVELLVGVQPTLEPQRFLGGQSTPVFFGSALNNYGVEHFLQAFLNLCPAPAARLSDRGLVTPDEPHFSGFVFKIQANLDPRHRDHVAFVRVCSGRFVRQMEVLHPRTGKRLRLNRASRLFAQERETVEDAWPGDIIGLINPGDFHLGDTICSSQPLNYEPLPQFSPEHFAIVRCKDTGRRKQFDRGLRQLVAEGAIQVFTSPDTKRKEPILAAVGELQFDVVRYRLESEYNADSTIEWLPYKVARWIRGERSDCQRVQIPYTALRAVDTRGRQALLFHSTWDANYCAKEHPRVEFREMPVNEEFAPATQFAGANGTALPLTTERDRGIA